MKKLFKWTLISHSRVFGTRTNKLFLKILREYLDHRIFKGQLSEGTKKKYDFCYNKIARFFINNGYHHLTIRHIDKSIFEDLRAWMHTPEASKSCGLTHSSRHLELCVGAMNYAVSMGYIKYNPIAGLETGRDKRKPKVYLEASELKKFINHNFESISYKKAQVNFVFQCATGISYANLYDYKTKIDNTGIWIEDNRKKVGQTPFYVPISAPGFELAKAIHDAYQGQLPKLANGCYNRYLKEMAAILGINKRITTHTSRKTLATLLDQEGFSLGFISSVLGHSEKVCKEDYISQSRKKIERELLDKYKDIMEQNKLISN